MRKINKLFTFITCIIAALAFAYIACVSNTVKVNADETVTYEKADEVSIGDIAGKKTIQLTSNTTYNYEKKAGHGSLIFSFDYEIESWTSSTDNMQIYFVVDDGSKEPWWNIANSYLFKYSSTHISYEKEDGSFGYNNLAGISGEDHHIEIGRLAQIQNKKYNGKYYCYIKVDDVEIVSFVNSYDYTKLTNMIFITANAANINKLTDPNYIEPTYETPDEISISDLSYNGKPVGGKLAFIPENRAFTYSKSATYGSVIVRFQYRIKLWTETEAHGTQFHFYSTWHTDGMFWLRNDKTYIAYTNDLGGTSYYTGPAIQAGNSDIEIGRLAIMKGEEYTGYTYLYIKVNGTLVLDARLKCTDTSYLASNSIYLTGDVNSFVDVNWTGNHVKFVSGGNIVDEYDTTDDYLTKPEDPEQPGKVFIGWFDDLGNEWDFDSSEVSGDMTLTAGFVSQDSQSVSNEEYFNDSTYTPVLRFLVSSDTHVNTSGNNASRLASVFDVAYGYAQRSTTYNGLDLALFAGDLSDDGSASALSVWKNTVNNKIQEGTELIVSMGNHEFRTYDSISHEISVFENATGEEADSHKVINGYHFITISPNLRKGDSKEVVYYSKSKVAWLEAQLAIAAEADPTKPIFVTQHVNVSGTVYGSNSWGNSDLTEVLCKYPQVVDFSGHSHYPLTDPRSIWQGTFTALSTGTLHYYEMGINGYKGGAVFPTDNVGGWASSSTSASTAAEFMIVEIDANNAMRVIVYDLLSNQEITRYYLRNLTEERKVDYSHTQRAKSATAPEFAEDAEITAVANEDTLAIEFDQAKFVGRNFVESYRVEFYIAGELVDTQYALSCYFRAVMPEKIQLNARFLKQNTEYTIKVYAVNVWNQVCEEPLVTTATTGTVTIYEDVVDEITLEDLYKENGKTQLTTDTLKSWLPSYFIPSENNVYGSFKLTLQLLYIASDFQFYWNNVSIYTNYDLLWVNRNEGSGIYMHEKKIETSEPLQPGLYTVVYGRYHITSGANMGKTCYYVDIAGEHYETITDRVFTNDGHIIFNFNSCYNAGSRYYSINEEVPKTETPEFENGTDIELTTPITNWNTTGGAVIFDSTSPSLSFELHDSKGAVTNAVTIAGSFKLGKKGDYYHYEVKTNTFVQLVGTTGEEYITKVRVLSDDFKIGNLEVVVYGEESFEPYDEISILDIGLPNNTGIYYDSAVEHGFAYAGSSETYSGVLKYYLICEDVNTETCEFRSQLGTLWSYFCTLWFQPGNSQIGFFGFQMTTRPIDKYTINLQNNTIYYVETGTIRVKTGEWAGWNYTYFKINDTLYADFYAPKEECASTSYQVAFKIKDGYKVADVSLARTIEYYVEGEKYLSQLAISGAKAFEPAAPTVEGKYFTGWYTAPTGGRRINFNDIFTSDASTVKYYAHFADEQFSVKFYNEDEEYQTQMVGKLGQALIPETPEKLGEYEYSFVKWVIRGTNQEFDFTTEITENIELEAVYAERKYEIQYRVDGQVIDSLTRYYLESNPVIIDGEPEVPSVAGAVGYWDYDQTSLTKGDTYAIARYDASVSLDKSSTLSLTKYEGAKVDIADELTRTYLSFTDTLAQAEWLKTYPAAGGHEIQDIKFEWNDTEKGAKYVVFFADNADFEDAYVVKTDKTYITDAGIFVPGKVYYWKVVRTKAGVTTESDVDTFEILNTPVRWISAGTVFNTRDIGGWTTTDGKQVKYGMMYRGGQLSLDQSGELSYMNALSSQVFDYLGMQTEIELRGESTHTINQFNELEKMVHVNGQGYTQFFKLDEKTRGTYREVFALMADESNYPFYFHCSWGADRTGGLGFLVNALLGVPYEQLVQDFELTSLSYSGTRLRVATGFDEMYTRFINEYGDGTDASISSAVYKFLNEFVGVPATQLDKIRELMLEPASEQAEQFTVTYRIDGEEYLKTNVFAGNKISSVSKVYFDKHLDCWLLNGEEFDFDTPVYSDLVLDAKYVATNYEPYDVVTVRDLNGMEEGWIPRASEPFKFEGTSPTGSRIFEFNYTIPTGGLVDGVHVEVTTQMWQFRAHVWIADNQTIHVFTSGTESPQQTIKVDFKNGQTYTISVGVVIPLEGDNAGKKVLILIIDGEIISQLETGANISNGYYFGFAGTQGPLTSTPNLKTITYKVAGMDDTYDSVTRGLKVNAPENPTAPENKVFLGWFDELGNKWDFANDKVLNDMSLYARFGDQTIGATVVDSNGIEVAHDYQVQVGLTVSQLPTPLVNTELLEFVGWFNGDAKLSDTDVITEDMNLICKFNVKASNNPDNPDNPVTPSDNGCKSSVAACFTSVALLAFAGLALLKKKKEQD